MKFKFILSLLLLINCLAAYSQQNPSGKTNNSNLEIVEKGLIKVSVMYPFADGKTFDMEYYETKHMPMVARFLGSNLVKYTIEKGTASGIPNTALPFMAIGSFYVKDLVKYQADIAPNREAIRSDFPNYTNISPVILISKIVK